MIFSSWFQLIELFVRARCHGGSIFVMLASSDSNELHCNSNELHCDCHDADLVSIDPRYDCCCRYDRVTLMGLGFSFTGLVLLSLAATLSIVRVMLDHQGDSVTLITALSAVGGTACMMCLFTGFLLRCLRCCRNATSCYKYDVV